MNSTFSQQPRDRNEKCGHTTLEVKLPGWVKGEQSDKIKNNSRTWLK